jgi:hypothetical protein
MITELHLQNFRGFDSHTVPLHSTTIVVGRNNAGKSTIVEALRLVSLVTSRYKALSFSNVPSWLDIPTRQRGVAPSLKNTEINLTGVFHRYGDPPARITAKFSSGEAVTIYLGEEALHAVILDSKGKAISSKGEAARISLPKVSNLPQIAPLAREERLLNPDYVNAAISSSLAPLHFRNQIHLLNNLYTDFRRGAESTWSGLRLRGLELDRESIDSVKLSLFVQDGDFTAEVGWMGHGLQMWLQTMWFLTRTRGDDTVILDEPDVYMHVDLQRKLIRHVRGRYPQVIIATHSSEIMAEVEPEDVLVVNRIERASIFAASFPAAQRVLTGMGSVHNLQLARLWTSRRFLMVEGDDIILLKRFQNTLFPESEYPIDTIPSMSVGGWGGWNYAVGSSMFLENACGEGIITYCLLDSDFHTGEEITNRMDEAKRRGVQLHVWTKKEIENYLLVPVAVQRMIASRIREGILAPTVEEVSAQIDKIATELYNDTFDALSSAIQHRDRKLDAGTANKPARARIDSVWKTEEGRFGIISGKRAISLLSQWAKDTYNVSFSSVNIAKELRFNEIAAEVKEVIMAIELNQFFPS